MRTVKDLMKEGKAINLMTPAGFVYLTSEQVKAISSGQNQIVNTNPGCSGFDMGISVDELLSYELCNGGYNAERDTNEYLVQNPESV